MKVKSFIKVFNHVDPLFIYIVVIYGISKVYQFVFDVESVWQTFWGRLQETLGNKEIFFGVFAIS